MIKLCTIQDFRETYHLILKASEWLKENNIDQWIVPISEEEFLGAIESKEVFVFFSINQIIGSVTLTEKRDPYWYSPEGKTLYLHRLVIDRNFKGLGIGTSLLRWSTRHALNSGFEYLRLDCIESNPVLKSYYLKQGFEYKGTGETYALFEKKLSENLS